MRYFKLNQKKIELSKIFHHALAISQFFIGIEAFAAPVTEVDLNPAVEMSQLTDSCKNFIEKTLPENQWTGGFVRVPENWQKPNGKSILVFYYHNVVSSKKSKPIIFLNGGPFFSAHNRMEALSKQVREYDTSDEKHTFVMMDQRGTGCSTPNLPQDSNINISQYRHYGSQSIVRDAEAIRKKLFGKTPWKIFSQSFGGYLTARYLQYFPSSVREVHTYAPAAYETMTDFFMLRGKSQHELMQRFLNFYQEERTQLEAALDKIKGPQGSNYCLTGGTPEQKVCGLPLFDAMAGAIGQGHGRGKGTTEVWDGVRKNLIALLESDSQNPDDPNHKIFVESAKAAGSFFYSPSIAVVFSIWMQDVKFISGNLTHDCDMADKILIGHGYQPENFLLNECRVIRSMIPDTIQMKLQEKYQFVKTEDYITQKRLVNLIKRNKNLKYYLYTGSLDSIVQIESLKTLIDSGATNYTNFPDSGHAGWLYESLVWERLMQ